MSSIAKANISLSKKDLSKSRIPPVASRNVVFYHKATAGSLTINLLALTMPSAEMPTATQATNPEISGAQLMVNKKNLELTSSSNGKLIQDLDYVVIDSYTISLIGPYIGVGAEADEIFVGTINSAPISDLVVASAKSVDKTYELAVGSTVLNLGREYKVGANPFENVGSIKVFVNGILALRDVDYTEIDSGNGYGSTIQFVAAPPTIPYQVAVDFGVMAITDNNAIGAIENLGGAIKKIADDLAVVAGTTASDYYSASPSEVERRAFGDYVLDLLNRISILENVSKPTVQVLTSGSGTYVKPAAALYLKVKMIGGGGGGSGSGTSAYGNGGAGGTTSFGTASAVGGDGGTGWSSNGGYGGVALLGSGMSGIALVGGSGGGCQNSFGSNTLSGGSGGSTPFGGAGGGGSSGVAIANAGYSAIPNSGSGGGGGGAIGNDSANSGTGGGAGGYIEAIISNPSSTYSYSIGAGGTAGSAGANGAAGGAGGSGIIIVEEYYS